MAALSDPDLRPRLAIGPVGLVVMAVTVAFTLATVAWAMFFQINGAVIAAGHVAVRGKPKAVQHFDGGIAEQILVEDGDFVEQGQVLIKLDPTLLASNLGIYRVRLANALALRDRLSAEERGLPEIVFNPFPDLLAGLDPNPFQERQSVIFASRQDVGAGRREQLHEKVRQYRNQIVGTEAVLASKRDQLRYLETELSATVQLQDKGLTRQSQTLALERGRSDLLGQIAEHRSELARIANSIRDTELEILLSGQQRQEEAVSELREVETTIEELTQQIIATDRQLSRIELRAPVAGTVHEMQVTTVGGVIPPGATILQIVPKHDQIVVEARVEPISVDQLHVGQNATLRFSAFNQRTTPEINGKVDVISPNVVVDPVTGMQFYRVFLSASPEEMSRLDGLEIVPGMPVEAFVQTSSRTVMSYLVKPMTDYAHHMLREE